MANLVFKRGSAETLKKTPLNDGMLSFTTDDGRIHLDYKDGNEIKRKTFYSGKLTFGSHVFDGTEDVEITVYEGKII